MEHQMGGSFSFKIRKRSVYMKHFPYHPSHPSLSRGLYLHQCLSFLSLLPVSAGLRRSCRIRCTCQDLIGFEAEGVPSFT
jgi:hypothetical protein